MGASIPHGGGTAKQALDVHPCQGRRQHPKPGKDRVASPDIGWIQEHLPKVPLCGEMLQRRTIVGDGDEVPPGVVPPDATLHKSTEEPVERKGLDGTTGLG